MGLIFSGSHPDSYGQSKTREAVVAGRFYPGNATQLNETLEDLFRDVDQPDPGGSVQALIVPHAGYVFSGKVTAAGFSQIDKSKTYKNIFILASSHHVSSGKASVYNRGNYKTPLGEAVVNLDIANKLIADNECFTFHDPSHKREHSIEVQVPFIQYYFEPPVPIVPIVLGTHMPETCKEIAAALEPYFNEDNLFVVSADFSHYPDYESANKVDHITADALCSGDPDTFLSIIESNKKKRIPGLVTSMCAWPAGLTLLYLAEKKTDYSFHKVLYKNSGDAKSYGDRSEVVGYHAISLVKTSGNKDFGLSFDDKNTLLDIARNTLTSYIPGHKKKKLDSKDFSPSLTMETGAFVSLKKEGKLRGCIGTFRPDEPLYQLIQTMTIASATEDTRFLPVQKKELKDIKIEISVLTPMEKIEDISDIILGKHGIYMKKDGRSGTFLPQVATETGWTLDEFLGHCARDKARIGWDGWKDAELFVFEAIVFGETI